LLDYNYKPSDKIVHILLKFLENLFILDSSEAKKGRLIIVDELKYMIWLTHMYGTNVQYIDKLMDMFGSAEGIYKAVGNSLKDSNILPKMALAKIVGLKKTLDPNELLNDMQCKGIWYIPKSSSKYPEALRTIDSPPYGLYVLGEMPSFDKLWVSVVGTRKPTDYGKTVTKQLAKELSEKGVIVVSGMADGLDGVANQAALEGGSPTVAVLGSGVDVCYPNVHEKLYEKIQQNGCILSEFPPGTRPEKWHFTWRNRIISGLSQVTIITEAEIKSGTSITINYALEQGREVMAVPGNITSKRSEGTNKLIKEGAHVATCAMDVLDVLGVIENETVNNINEEIHNIHNIPLAPNEKTVYSLLVDGLMGLDEIIKKSGLEPREVMVVITKLVISGKIRELPGQKYII